jgi:hypothetical protein
LRSTSDEDTKTDVVKTCGDKKIKIIEVIDLKN